MVSEVMFEVFWFLKGLLLLSYSKCANTFCNCQQEEDFLKEQDETQGTLMESNKISLKFNNLFQLISFQVTNSSPLN